MKPINVILVVFSVIIASVIGLFYLNEDIRNSIRNIKGDEQPTEISDEYLAQFDKLGNISCDCKCPEPTCPTLTPQTPSSPVETTTSTGTTPPPTTPEIDYSPLIESIIAPLKSYDFKKMPYDEYHKIYGLTDEYPDTYERYETKFGEAYFFVGNTHDALYQFFEVQADKLSFQLKKVNNFSKRSFYINLNNSDDTIRVVIETPDMLYGLSIKRNYYPELKKLLKNL